MPRRQRLDALILGGGMAGISAALSLRGFGLDALILEEALLPGGQLHEIHAAIVDYPLAHGVGGARFAARVLDEARAAKLSILVGSPVRGVSVKGLWAEREDGRIHARALLIATGLRRRALGVPGEAALKDRGISHSANRDRTIYAGRPVVVIGGGTAAVEDALLCAEVGSTVTLIHRSTHFRARTDFLASARKHPAIKIVPNAEVRRILGEEHVEGVQYRVRGSRITRVAQADAVIVRIGWQPRTEPLRGQIGLDRQGYVRVRPGGATTAPAVYAAGDVCSPRWPSIANAAGQGAAAAWEIAHLLGRFTH
jgi:thioredoxin reductase (NADPH)